MSVDLDSFIHATEGEKVQLSPKESKGLQYPFLYVTEITDVEVRHLVDSGILQREPLSSEYLQLFLKNDGYRLLGYVALNFSTVLHLNYLREHDVQLKANRDSKMSITHELFEDLLLSR